MTWRKNTNEEIEELRRFVDGMKRGQTLATGDSLLETLRQIHDRREASILGHDHKQMLRERLRRQIAAREGTPVEDSVPAPVFIKPVARRRVLRWAAAASLVFHVGLGAAVLPNVEFDATILGMPGEQVEVTIIDLRENPFFVPAPPRPTRTPKSAAPKSEREPSAGVEGRGRDEATAGGPERASAAPAVASRPIGPPVAPWSRPVVQDFGGSVAALAEQSLPAPAGSLPDGPRPEKVRPVSDVMASSFERVGPVAQSFDVRPKILVMPRPIYTPKALRDQVEGTVRLSVLLSADGAVREIQVVRSLGSGLDEAAIEAAHKIKFMPATRNGSPVSARVKVDVTFSLR